MTRENYVLCAVCINFLSVFHQWKKNCWFFRLWYLHTWRKREREKKTNRMHKLSVSLLTTTISFWWKESTAKGKIGERMNLGANMECVEKYNSIKHWEQRANATTITTTTAATVIESDKAMGWTCTKTYTQKEREGERDTHARIFYIHTKIYQSHILYLAMTHIHTPSV